MLLQVLFCAFALYMLAKYLPEVTRRRRSDAEGEDRRGGAVVPIINVVLAFGILVTVLLSAVMKAMGHGLISK